LSHFIFQKVDLILPSLSSLFIFHLFYYFKILYGVVDFERKLDSSWVIYISSGNKSVGLYKK